MFNFNKIMADPRCLHQAVEGTPQSQLQKKASHLLEISHMYYAIASGVAAMCIGKTIHALCQTTKVCLTGPQLDPFTPSWP